MTRPLSQRQRPATRPRIARPLARGLSIVELMIGVTIGLFILAGATLVASTQLSDNRKMLVETQLQQDMRAAMDIMVRDVRRAGYWAHSWRNVWPANQAAALGNPYNGVTAEAARLLYARSQDEVSTDFGEDNDAVDDDERVGFRLNTGTNAVDMHVSADNWQALTDPNVMQVTDFSITFNDRALPAPCAEQCPLGPSDCPMVLKVRDVTIVLKARATHDPSVVRSVQSDVRLRNDLLTEDCP